MNTAANHGNNMVHRNCATKADHVASKLPIVLQSASANPMLHSKPSQTFTDKENLVSCSLPANCDASSIKTNTAAADAAASATKIAGEARQQAAELVRYLEEQRALAECHRFAACRAKTESMCAKSICAMGQQGKCDIRPQLPIARRWPSRKSATLVLKEHDRDGTWDTDFPKTPKCARAKVCRQSRSGFRKMSRVARTKQVRLSDLGEEPSFQADYLIAPDFGS